MISNFTEIFDVQSDLAHNDWLDAFSWIHSGHKYSHNE